jgi:hypothetical protein
MQLVKDMNEKDITTYSGVPKVYCKAFEDNSGALEITRTHKMRPRTKHNQYRRSASSYHDEAHSTRYFLQTQEGNLWVLKVWALIPHKSPSEGVWQSTNYDQ